MPGFDGTGPMGRGAMTGRGAGRCRGNTDSATITGEKYDTGMPGRFMMRRTSFKFSMTGGACGRGFRAGCLRRNNTRENPGK